MISLIQPCEGNEVRLTYNVLPFRYHHVINMEFFPVSMYSSIPLHEYTHLPKSHDVSNLPRSIIYIGDSSIQMDKVTASLPCLYFSYEIPRFSDGLNAGVIGRYVMGFDLETPVWVYFSNETSDRLWPGCVCSNYNSHPRAKKEAAHCLFVTRLVMPSSPFYLHHALIISYINVNLTMLIS